MVIVGRGKHGGRFVVGNGVVGGGGGGGGRVRWLELS